jgi:hypothetical protein
VRFGEEIDVLRLPDIGKELLKVYDYVGIQQPADTQNFRLRMDLIS